MSSPLPNEGLTRHFPVARQRVASTAASNPYLGGDTRETRRRTSETRLQAAVQRSTIRDERDPYADVPCTD